MIICRGDSGSGITTVAKELQKKFGKNTMIISQDVMRRDMLKVKDGETTEAMPLIQELFFPLPLQKMLQGTSIEQWINALRNFFTGIIDIAMAGFLIILHR